MGDPKRFWKESIGVTGPVRPKSSAPAPPKAPSGAPGPATGPATGPTGPAAGLTCPVAEQAGTRPSSEPPRRTERLDRTGPVGPGGAPAINLALVADTLWGLPLGSVVFADEVARRLWSHPTASDLKAVATVLEQQGQAPPGPIRDLVVRAVALRQRAQRLLELAARGTLDAAQRSAFAAEWSRLARTTREASVELDVRLAEQDRAVLRAAATLLGDADHIEAEATLAAECAALLDEENEGDREALDVPDARELLATMRAGAPRPHDPLFLEILATWTLARRAVKALDVGQLERARAVIARVAQRTDALIARVAAEHRRDPEGNARLAAWRRFLLDARGRVDETLTRPLSTPTRPRPQAAETGPGDERILEHLREARRRAARRDGVGGGEDSKREPTSAGRGGLRGWLARILR